MSIENSINTKLNDELLPNYLVIENESHMHSGPATESHFRLVVVSEKFSGLRLVQRHQTIYKILADELAGPVHALSMHLYTPQEWQQREGEAPLSPRCMGGSKADK
ncbi:BolA family protein [Marinobacterium arenosum]|uniref:BolA family protein n=1 Tax=Marinobacterium arenosum TaxID=2862496 RepID=UPI001C98D19D|nr:BolA family protein [Marinobacterium arenosum]MBY4678736.1 BolA family transcriptional regulator [Marinobacterium arenosum]